MTSASPAASLGFVGRPEAADLDDALVQRVTDLCDRGDADVEAGRFPEAIEKYEEALTQVPKPVYAWKVTAWILTALGETYFFDKQYAAAVNAINEAFRCPGAINNPFLHLRLGQAELELGNAGRAKDELRRAYRRAGEDLFKGEDPKYFDLIKDTLDDENE